MATFEVTSPDGKTWDVTAPEGATQDQVLAYAKQQFAQQQTEQAAAKQRSDAAAYAGQDVGAMGSLMRGLGGAKHAFDRAAYGLENVVRSGAAKVLPEGWVDPAIDPEHQQQLEQGRAFTKEGGTAAKVGEFAGDVAITAPIGGAATGALRLGTAALPRVVGALARGGGELATGAGIGAATAMPGERGQGAAGGAAGSALGMGINRFFGGLVKPLVSPEAQALMREGVQPSVGQSIGGGIGKLEEKATSLPFIGTSVARARNRALDEFNEAAIKKAAPEVSGIGDAAMARARDAISKQYDNALSQMPKQFAVEADPIIAATVKAVDDPALGLSKDAQGRVLDYVQKNLLSRASNVSPDVAKRVESDMGQVVSRWRSNPVGEERAMADALEQVHSQWRDSLTAIGNMTDARAGDALRQADKQWRAFRALDRAAASAGAQGAEEAGRFTPRQLRRAIEAEDKSQFNRATRYGTVDPSSPFGQLNTLSRAGDAVLPARVPDSGTAGRMLPTLGALGLGGGAATGVLGPGGLAALGAAVPVAMLGSTRAGQQFATQGVGPAIDALVKRGLAPEQAARWVQKWGPDAVLSVFRAGAPQVATP